jgi:excisionase family DNA binding protein
MPRSLLLDHAAELLGVSRRTVYYRIREGRLRTIRTQGGSQRVLLDSIEALLREEVLRAMGPSTGRGAGASGTDPSARFPAL